MGNVQSCALASISACSAYFVYVHIYRSHKLLKTNELDYNKLPSFAYLYLRYLSKAVARRKGHFRATNRCGVLYTIVHCRLDTRLLRRFCSAAGYGWDYPDSEFRDLPLCFPEFLCSRLLLMVLTDGQFGLSPAGLHRLRQTLRTFEPVDELKKGPFTLQAGVLTYRQTEACVEVDIRLSATSRTGSLVWESVLTLVSQDKQQGSSRSQPSAEMDEPDPEDVKRVELRVPRTADLPGLWSVSQYSPCLLLSLPARLLGFTSPSLWMLSVCLAEIEKHKGVKVITAPVSISARFKHPPSLPRRVTIQFGESTNNVRFHMHHHGGDTPHVTGLISRS
ncbi:uncharacterized protein [Takifugu rubripes]|uniref:uncharacterized protein n=1 Tax=Takifugu rubripes TaxID=31033 RepID=UPI0005D1EC59|nr:uncharacterized protein LOC105418013 [Takifugu rubripes]|eukprot:XP_011613742.1 PREDICTED: uncharacterized protein LOC105418013 [Takifugu rubripes]